MRAYAVLNDDGTTFDVMIARYDADNEPVGETYMGLSITLGSSFDFSAAVDGTNLVVTANGSTVTLDVDGGFDSHMIYAKWGAYASTNEADVGDYSEVTYYDYSVSYD